MKFLGDQKFRAGYTLTETVVSAGIFSLILGAVVVGSVALQRGFASAEGFAASRMHLPDLISMDARRGYTAIPTQTTSGTYSLPLTIVTPAIYNSDGKTMMDPARTKVITTVIVKGGKSGKNPHNYKRITWPLSYGTSGATPTTTITYTLNGTNVVRTAGGVSRTVATGVQSVSFDPPNYDLTRAEAYFLTCRITFLKSIFTKTAEPTSNILVSSILTRGDFYDNDHD
ncbi:MAG: hypothetical protein ABI946_06765 [Chthoniobacterales bacterium]